MMYMKLSRENLPLERTVNSNRLIMHGFCDTNIPIGNVEH